MTALQEEGLWPCAAGEDFGCNSSVAHPLLGNDAKDAIFGPMRKEELGEEDGRMYQRGVEEAERVWNAVEDSIDNALGWRHARFVNDFFYGTSENGNSFSSGDDKQLAPVSPSSALNSEQGGGCRIMIWGVRCSFYRRGMPFGVGRGRHCRWGAMMMSDRAICMHWWRRI